MERPHHLQTGSTSNSSKLTGFVIVVLIHVAAIAALVTALASGQIMKQIQDIKASVEAEKTPPKAPPPPPPDLAKPPPPVAIVPEFSVQTEAPPVVHTQVAPPPAPPKAVAPPAAPTQLEPIQRTHTIPPYPTISQRLGEQGTSQLQVAISTEGSVTDCKVIKSSGSERLDNAACEYVKGHWRWKPPTQEGKPVAVNTDVSVVWNLKDAQ
jgi:protein TonB